MWWLLLIILNIILLAGYLILIEKYRLWFSQITPFTFTANTFAPLHISVIIPARNEERNLGKYLPAILQQNYPANSFEVIVVNDHSNDKTADVVTNLQQRYPNLRLLNLSDMLGSQQLNSYKKKAIELAVGIAAGQYIVCTDADCLVTPNWLAAYSSFIQHTKAEFVAAPVRFINNGSVLSIFQCLDFISLQGITAASVHHKFHNMCNGANLAYSKAAFYQVGGFAGIDAKASGDDMFLMQKIASQHPAGVHYLLAEEAIVDTLPMTTWSDFINQRIRWASKAEAYDDKRITGVLVLVYLMNFILLALIVSAIWRPVILISWLLLLSGKIMIEMRFMQPVATFYKQQPLLKWFGIMQPVHILYTVVAGWLGKFGTYRWKGRRVK